MESLLSNYASSDEEEEEQLPHDSSENNKKQPPQSPNPSNPRSFFSTLPPPKSSSSPFLSLPPPKSQSKPSPNLTNSTYVNPLRKQEFQEEEERNVEYSDKPSSLFSSIPQPKSTSSSSSLFDALPLPNPVSSLDPKPKRVVQFKPPVNPFSVKSNIVDEEDEEEDEGEKERKRKKSESFAQTPSVKSFLSSIPAPKNSTSLGVLGSGSGRRSTIDADVPVPNSTSSNTQNEVVVNSNVGYNGSQQIDEPLVSSMGGFSAPSEHTATAGDYSDWGAQGYANPAAYPGYGDDGASDYSHGDYSHVVGPIEDYAPYGSNLGTSFAGYEEYNWTDGVSSATEAIMETAEVALRLPGKRGRRDAPPQIIEVSQDELMKNRPREDQTRLTGIAFGPSYQPASSKGKPSKLHKRKHQINTLYFDMKQKEMELAERRAKGMQTKAQTQGKYGW